MPLDFGHALATSFPLSRYIPSENIHAVNTSTFSPQATFYRNRYGALPTSVKGWPDDQLQHGQSTFWLGPLLTSPAFLAAHPEWTGVTVSEPPSVQDYTDLCFAASATLGGAYTWLRDQADMLGLLGSNTATGPKSTPGAPGVAPTMTPVASAPAAPSPVPATPSLPVVASSADPSAWTDADTAALVSLIERHLPGRGAQLAKLVETAGKIIAAGGSSAAFIAALPEIEAELGVSDPRIAAALGLIAIFTR